MLAINLLAFLQFIGVAAFAVSGALVAGEREMDWFGVVVLGVIVAVGGGTLRDMMLGATPVFWIVSPWYVAVASGFALATIPLVMWGIDVRRPMLIADAIGLAVFAVLGTRKALDMGISGSVAVIMGVVTGVFGGLIRDVLANRTPIILKREVYAIAALIGAALFVLLRQFDLPAGLDLWGSIAVALAIRLAALAMRWSIPTFKVEPTEPE
ncbi:trimeric intracellular cation channel family protein [Parvibaculum sedimenti]|uniref:Trimeric intracellular cation channel family protein n=1 Tax=Parvibaculum sedimenti TaxID=2608632 RepID=A0A6N6VL72_9HYPH|nr:trimeric intracellular cation channel family protein [Parvibaculum sedimenti]KAB7740168.1 trimeric intracellular cation channel family protein [Parvibaculum sedimenti]